MTKRELTTAQRHKRSAIALAQTAVAQTIQARPETLLRKGYVVMNGPNLYLCDYRLMRFAPAYALKLQPEWRGISDAYLRPLVFFNAEMVKQIASEVADATNDVRVEMIRI